MNIFCVLNMGWTKCLAWQGNQNGLTYCWSQAQHWVWRQQAPASCPRAPSGTNGPCREPGRWSQLLLCKRFPRLLAQSADKQEHYTCARPDRSPHWKSVAFPVLGSPVGRREMVQLSDPRWRSGWSLGTVRDRPEEGLQNRDCLCSLGFVEKSILVMMILQRVCVDKDSNKCIVKALEQVIRIKMHLSVSSYSRTARECYQI